MRVIAEKFKNYTQLIKVEHTIFALPFALTSALIAADGFPSFYQIFWITVALFGGRTSAMSLNRLIDAAIDAMNPRTKDRHIPSGRVKRIEAFIIAIAGFCLMVFSAYKLNPLAFKLSPIAILILSIYSFTKRFTWACHLVLGIAVSLAPLGAWIAVKGSANLSAFILSLSVALWVAGFDIVYALQDVDFDKEFGIYSIPARLGIKNALLLSRVFHIITFLGLILVGLMEHLNLVYFIGLFIVAYFMAREHFLIAKDRSKIDYAFFNLNGYISLTVFIFTSLSYLWRLL